MSHNLEYNYRVCDIVLDMFDNVPAGVITNAQLYGSGHPLPPDQNEVLSFLVSEGLLEQIPYGFKITYKGRMIIHQGGFRKLHRRESLVRVCSVVAAIAGVVAVVFQVLFQLL